MVPATVDLREAADAAARAAGELIARYSTDRVKMTSVLRQGDAAAEIAAAARDANADLIVVGTQARTGVARVLLGDVAQTVVRSTNLPVMLLHDPLDSVS